MVSRSAINVANYMIVQGPHLELTNLKIQKLLYLAFGLYFIENRDYLFYDTIEAWGYGPVVQSVYHYLLFYGDDVIKSPISMPDRTVPSLAQNDDRAINCVNSTFELFGKYASYQLMHWSHMKDGPWELTYDDRKSGFAEIDKQVIGRHFVEKAGYELSRTLKAV